MSDVVVVVVVAVIEEQGYGAPASTLPEGTNTRDLVRKVHRTSGWGLCTFLKNHRIIDCTRVCMTLILTDLDSHRLEKRFKGAFGRLAMQNVTGGRYRG